MHEISSLWEHLGMNRSITMRSEMNMRTLNVIALALLIVGGLNWLLVGLFEYDLVASVFGGQDSAGARIIYTIVGLCALYSFKFFNNVSREEHAR